MDWYCPLPFKHAFVDSAGVAACCQTPRVSIGLQNWGSSKYLRDLQAKILSGTMPAVCQGCKLQEQTQGRSLRTDALHDYGHKRFVETDIDFIDYRSSNICNFKCRTCEPAFSHGIANETRNHSELQKFYQVINSKTVNLTQDNTVWVHENLDKIKRLMITGGEPTFIPEIKNIVERIVYDELDIDLLITTNASFVDDFWCEATRLHSKLHWTVSIDAVGEAAEIIRYGTNWQHVERNIRWLSQHAKSMDINTVVSNINLLQLRPLLKFVLEIRRESRSPRGLHGEHGCRHQFHISQRPYHLAADNWPNELMPKVIHHLQQCLELPLDPEQTAMVAGLLTKIETSTFDEALWLNQIAFNNALDKIRNQNYNTLYITKDSK